MLHAVSFALADSVNVLLIGVLFAVAVMHPKPRRYAPIAAVLVAGDWFGVFLLSLAVLLLFNGISDAVPARFPACAEQNPTPGQTVPADSAQA